MSESTGPSIEERMAAVMKAVSGVKKDQWNPHGKYKYAGHEQVTHALRDAYVKHGILRTASVKQHARDVHGTLSLLVRITWINVDNPKDTVAVDVVGEAPTTTSSGKATGQQAGVALSYAVKQAEFKAFSLLGDDTPNPEDDDEASPVIGEFIERFQAATSVADIEAISADVRAAGSAIASGRAALLDARAEAMKRVSK